MLSISSKQFISAALLSLTLAFSPSATVANILVSPDGLTRQMLLDRLSGGVPNFDEMAKETGAYRQADEFTRHEVATAEENRLRAVWDDLADVTKIQFNSNGRIGEYDGAAGGFPVSLFEPGTHIQGAVPIYFSNASDVRIFPVAPEEGRETLQKFEIARSATITVTPVSYTHLTLPTTPYV